MTDDTPDSGPDSPPSPMGPGQRLAAELLTASAHTATTAWSLATGPKIPPFQDD